MAADLVEGLSGPPLEVLGDVILTFSVHRVVLGQFGRSRWVAGV